MLPPIHPGYARKIALASALVWVLIRAVLILTAKTVTLEPRASVFLVGATVLLVWFDGRRHNEHLFHSNLGTPPALGTALSLATAGALELFTTVLLVPLLPPT